MIQLMGNLENMKKKKQASALPRTFFEIDIIILSKLTGTDFETTYAEHILAMCLCVSWENIK